MSDYSDDRLYQPATLSVEAQAELERKAFETKFQPTPAPRLTARDRETLAWIQQMQQRATQGGLFAELSDA